MSKNIFADGGLQALVIALAIVMLVINVVITWVVITWDKK
jgi:hypothetical protein